MTTRKLLVLVIISISVLLSTFLLLDHRWGDPIQLSIGPEAFKAVIQFTLGTMFISMIVAYLGLAKEEQSKKESEAREEQSKKEMQDSIKRNLIYELDRLYRQTKQIKRTLKSRMTTLPDKRLRFDVTAFEEKMDDLNEAQLAVELMRKKIRYSDHLYPEPQITKLAAALDYAASYLHDVHGDFRNQRTAIENGAYIISIECRNINDFISDSTLPEELKQEFGAMNNRKETLDNRWVAFKRICKIQREKNYTFKGQRFRTIADECFRLVTEEIFIGVANHAGLLAQVSDLPKRAVDTSAGFVQRPGPARNLARRMSAR